MPLPSTSLPKKRFLVWCAWGPWSENEEEINERDIWVEAESHKEAAEIALSQLTQEQRDLLKDIEPEILSDLHLIIKTNDALPLKEVLVSLKWGIGTGGSKYMWVKCRDMFEAVDLVMTTLTPEQRKELDGVEPVYFSDEQVFVISQSVSDFYNYD